MGDGILPDIGFRVYKTWDDVGSMLRFMTLHPKWAIVCFYFTGSLGL